MGLTGSIILAFIVFHLLHFTVRTIYPEYAEMMTTVGSPEETEIHDAFLMVISGFKHDVISSILCRGDGFTLCTPSSWFFECFSISRNTI